MIRSSRGKWVSGIGTMVLSVGLLVAGCGTGGGAGNHTLRWDTNNPPASRFATAFPGAVLDKNTGLVWEQSPDSSTNRTWSEALFWCVNRTVGGTSGWRQPSVVELKSLLDFSLPAPHVPASVFSGVQGGHYWSATTNAEFPTDAWKVDFTDGLALVDGKSGSNHAWCARGGMHADAY